MNQRFLILTFEACTVMFAGIWAATAPTTHRAAAAVSTDQGAVMYADCDAVRAANAAPLRASQPGYRPALDPNMNGIACEAVGAPDPAPVTGAQTPSDPGVVPDTSEPPPVGQSSPTPSRDVVEDLPAMM